MLLILRAESVILLLVFPTSISPWIYTELFHLHAVRATPIISLDILATIALCLPIFGL